VRVYVPKEDGSLVGQVEAEPDGLGHGLAGLVKPVLRPQEGQHQLISQLPALGIGCYRYSYWC
jgi:hypothetical protein